MIVLTIDNDKDYHLLRIIRKNTKTWKILFGPWYKNKRETPKFDTTEEIIMDAHGLRQFAQEILRILMERSIKEQELKLKFVKNKPQFLVKMRLMKKGIPLYRDRLEGMFECAPYINAIYSKLLPGREEEQYIENGGRYIGRLEYYTPDILEKFAEALEQESQQ